MIKEQLDETTEVAAVLNDIATVGAILKAAREKKGVTVEAAALQLHLRPRILNDIEADNFTNISSNTYARGYIKNYARFVDADIVLIKQCLDQQIPEYVPPTMQSFSRKTTRQARDSRVNLVTYAIVIILLAMLVLWWVQKSDVLTESNFALPTVEEIQAETANTQSGVLVPTQRDVATGSIEVIEPTNPQSEQLGITENELIQNAAETNLGASEVNQTDNLVSNSNASSNNGSANRDNLSATQQPSVIVPAPIASIPSATADNNTVSSASTSVVTMDVTADCWINLVDVTGKVLIDGVKKSGHNVKVTGEAPFKLILGAPQSVTLAVDGNNIDLSEYTNGRVARLTLTKP
ncbi:RodZ domain-containing protein [Shewanella sp. HL-SH8]|uniref:RodZ domain-containing protein n=1 Tax=Shewanella sp. HL-SH8 TaxID=3436242 RepID=UPI003EB6CE2D